MHVVPIMVEEGMTVSSVFSGPVRCGAPSMIGIAGTDAQGEAVSVVGSEWPVTYSEPSGSRADARIAAEQRHLARFRADLGRTGADPYEGAAQPGANPPDFVCQRGRRSVGIEMTQLVVQDRVAQYNMFRRVRAAVLGMNRHRFRALAGHVVYVSFLDARPFKGSMEVSALIHGLGAFTPTPPPSSGGAPKQLDPNAVKDIAGAKITAAPLSMDPGTPFYRRMGWELAVAQTSLIRDSDAWARLEKLVADHDQAGVDELIVAAGAPVVAGLAYPSDDVLAGAVIRSATRRAVTANHIERIFVYVWSGRAVAELSPGQSGFQHLCGDLPAV
jgi:hypothetical protein